MLDYRNPWRLRVAGALNKLLRDAGQEALPDPSRITVEIPPRPELGDLAFPMFNYARLLRKGPPWIAQTLCSLLSAGGEGADGGAGGAASGESAVAGGGVDGIAGDAASGVFSAEGPYLNLRLNRRDLAAQVLAAIFEGEGTAQDFPFGRPGTLAGSRIMVEFSSPNTNKPLHLGHLRNNALGESISRILRACGAELRKVCIINDRGIHICKSMLAYREQGGGTSPESEGIKSDRFVGDWYVRFSRDLKDETDALVREQGLDRKDAEARAPLMIRAQELLRQWEAGDGETVELWKTMNRWAVGGMKQTWDRTGIGFDKLYYESQTYLLGKDEILKGLERGIFYRDPDGSVQVDLGDEKLDKKVLLRKDGTSIYITQDIGTAIFRHRDWPFDRLVYVVGSEQQYHFKVLFTILNKLGFEWAGALYHLSYGMVNLPEGKMKSREGTVVDADDLIDSLRDMALQEIRNKEREEAVGDPQLVAEKIALGALHYYLLQVSPVKDMLFDPKESLSFNGNTGPYLQYMGARLSALLHRARESTPGQNAAPLGQKAAPPVPWDSALLDGDAEWDLIKTLADYPAAVAQAAAGMDPSVITAYLYELSKNFSHFYHDCPILGAETAALTASRLALSRAVLLVLRDALALVNIPFLEAM
ncbi:MAG: arginine--tRNA ligase [Treponema sp.]|jgi:arginyl-tRNA synthetase|nr:arginine--tRNA ligase [Treponema sp.]